MKSIYENQMPAGCEPANSRGELVRTAMPVGVQQGTSPAPWSGVEYEPPTPTCAWFEYSCGAYPVKGEQFCIGHLRRFLKQQAEQGIIVEQLDQPEQEPDGS